MPLKRQLACAQRTIERERKRMARLTVNGTPFNKHAWEAELLNMEAIVGTLEKCLMLEQVGDQMKLDYEKRQMDLAAIAQPAS